MNHTQRIADSGFPTGKLENGTFVARNDSLVTLCPSKFSDRPDDTSPT